MKLKHLTSSLIILSGALAFSNTAHAGTIVEGTCYMQTEKAIISSSCKNDGTSCEKGKSVCDIKGYTQMVSAASKTGGRTAGRAEFQDLVMSIDKTVKGLLKNGQIWFTQPEKGKSDRPKMQSMAAAPCVNPFEPCGGGIGMPPKALGMAVNMGGKVHLIDIDVLPPVCEGCGKSFRFMKLPGPKWIELEKIEYDEDNSLMYPP